MSNIKISEMTEATELNDNDLLTIVQGGLNKKITKQNAIGDIIGAINNPTYTTTEGTDLTINNTRVGNMYIEYYGNTTQETTTGRNYFNALAIPSSTNIVVSDEGKTIAMPVGTTGNGYVSTGKTLSELAPTLQVNDQVYLIFTRNLTNTNKFIYINGADFLWSVNSKATITQAMLDGVVALYGNKPSEGETTQCILTDFRMVKNLTDTWEKFTYGASPSPSYPQQVKNVTGENTINIIGKNWLNIKNYTGYSNNGLNYTIQDGIITITGTAGSQGNSSMALTSLVDFETINKIPLGTYITFSVLDIEGVAASQIFMGSSRKPILVTTECKYKKSFRNKKY